MNYQIKECQSRLFNKLFATLPSIRKANNFSKDANIDFNINHFYFTRKKDFWFAKVEKEDKYYFLFGLKDKPLKDICGSDACLIIDFDKNIQFNDVCLGFFGIKNSEIHIFINNKILNERCPYINTSDFKISNFKSFDNSIEFEIIDLGDLDENFIDNIEKLIRASANAEHRKSENPKIIEKKPNICQICSKPKNKFKIDSNLKNLRTLKTELCAKCIEKIVASEFHTKLIPMLDGNGTEELKIAREKFGNDQVFDVGLRLLEKYNIIKYIGVKKLFYTIDKDSYLVKKYMKYSDKNNLLLDNILKIDKIKEYENNEINRKVFFENLKSGKTKEESAENGSLTLSLIDNWYLKGSENKEPFVEFYNKYLEIEKNKKPQIPRVVKTDAFGNKNTITQMNVILEDLTNGKSEDEAISHANVSRDTYKYWINRGKQDFGEVYVQFYRYIGEIKSKPDDSYKEISDEFIGEDSISVDRGIYEPLLPEYEDLFTSMNQTGIAWVDEDGDGWIYSRNINGKTVNVSANTIIGLYEKVNNNNLIWGIRDYDRAKEFIDIPDDFEIPKMEIEESADKIDYNIYAPLPEEYEKTFSSMNRSGIAWVNQIGSKLYYVKSSGKKNIRLSGENIYELYKKVKKANQIWGIRDYGRAKEFIDIPDDFEIPIKPQVEEPLVDDIDVDSGIYSPLPEEYESSFSSMNQSGIAWVNQIGKRWIYSRKNNGKTIKFDDENICMLYMKVKNANQIWGIRDYSKASQYIDIPDDFEIPIKQETEENEFVLDNEINQSIYAPLSKDHLSKFNPNPNNKTGIAWVNKVGNKWFYQRQRNGKTVKFSDSNIVKLHEKVINNNQIWGITDINKARKAIETNSLDDDDIKPSEVIKPSIIDSKVTVTCTEISVNEFEILIKGIIKNKDLIDVLVRLDLFKENIKRIITTSINKEFDIFIELEINRYLLHTFEEKIEDLGWKINK